MVSVFKGKGVDENEGEFEDQETMKLKMKKESQIYCFKNDHNNAFIDWNQTSCFVHTLTTCCESLKN